MSINVADRIVVLRNLKFRNYLEGVTITGFGRVHIDNCRFENNLDNGVRIAGNTSQVVISRSYFDGQGRRIGSAPNNTPSAGNGNGIRVENSSEAKISNTVIWNSRGAGIALFNIASAQVYQVETYFNNPNLSGNVTIASNANFAQ